MSVLHFPPPDTRMRAAARSQCTKPSVHSQGHILAESLGVCTEKSLPGWGGGEGGSEEEGVRRWGGSEEVGRE